MSQERNLMPARITSPGQILKRELDARGWTQKDLAEILGRPQQAVSEIIKGAKQITPETAIELAAAFGTSSELWNNLEANYRLRLAMQKADKKAIARKSRIYGLLPIAEMGKRGWLEVSVPIGDLERQVCAFLGVDSLEEQPKLAASFRYSRGKKPETPSQLAWIKRVEHLARQKEVASFDVTKLEHAIPALLNFAERAEDADEIPMVLKDLGVRLLIVPHLSGTYLDGAAFFLEDKPVVALSLRYDRIDAFWFTLMHELAHIIDGHRGAFLDNFDEEAVSAEESVANQKANDWLLDPRAFQRFVASTKPYFSREKIVEFAKSQNRHPGIVLGRLQHEGLVPYQNLRGLLTRISPLLKELIDA